MLDVCQVTCKNEGGEDGEVIDIRIHILSQWAIQKVQ